MIMGIKVLRFILCCLLLLLPIMFGVLAKVKTCLECRNYCEQICQEIESSELPPDFYAMKAIECRVRLKYEIYLCIFVASILEIVFVYKYILPLVWSL